MGPNPISGSAEENSVENAKLSTAQPGTPWRGKSMLAREQKENMTPAPKLEKPRFQENPARKTTPQVSGEVWKAPHLRDLQPVTPTKFSSRFLGFVSKIRDPKVPVSEDADADDAQRNYVFCDGLMKPQFCPRLQDLKVPIEAFIPLKDQKQTDMFYSKLSFVTDSTNWGFDPSKTQAKPYIDSDYERLKKKNKKEPTPVNFFIDAHPEVFHEIKPNFVCNRYIIKKIMLLQSPTCSVTFHAWKKNGTIYFQQIYDAHDHMHSNVKILKPGKDATNAILSMGSSNEDPIDLNEAVYGAYVAQVGDDFKIMFTAELDAFWSLNEGETPSTAEMHDRVVELKTTHQYVWINRQSNWISVMASAFVQSFLIGGKDIVCGILLKTGRVAQILHYNVKRILDHLKGYDGHSDANTEAFYVNRLKNALSTIWTKVQEDEPAFYHVTVTQHTRAGDKLTTGVTRIYPDFQFPVNA